MNNISTFDLADDFLTRLADFIEETYIKPQRDMSRLAIVFSGKRPSLFLKRELAKRINKSFFPPVFFAIDEFVDYLLLKKESFTKASDLDVCYMIFQLALKNTPQILKGKETFAKFLPWAREILSFVEELDLEDVPSENLRNIELNAQIGYAIPQDINVLLENIITLRKACHFELSEKRSYTRGLRYLLTSQAINDLDFSEFAQILFCGFFSLNKTEKNIIQTLYRKGKAHLFLQGQGCDWPVLNSIARDFSHPVESPVPAQKPSYKLELYAGFDTHSQAGLIREIVKKLKNPDRTVIVLPNPDHIIPLLSELNPLIRDFNISMGYPLKRSSFYSLFEFVFNAQSTRKKEAYYSKDYLKVMRHPFVKNLKLHANPTVTRILVHKIEEILLGREITPLGGSLFIKLDEIQGSADLYELTQAVLKKLDIKVSREELKGIVKELHQILFEDWEKVDQFHGFALILEKFLDVFVKKSFLSSYPLNLNIASRIFDLKEELKSASFNKEKFPPEEIFKIFKNRMDRELVAFLGSPLKGMQILGLLETRSLNFENVIVMDVNEGVLPALRIYEPLIPREVMVSLNLDRLEQEEEIQRYQFKRLIASAKNVHLVYEESRNKEKSRFVEELIWELQKEHNTLDVVRTVNSSFSIKVMPKFTDIKKTTEVINFLKGFTYSASSINTYVKCPLQFYYRYVLGMNEKEDLLEEPENRQVGIFVHDLLEETFQVFLGKKPVIDSSFRKFFMNTMENKFAERFGKSMRSDSFLLKSVLDVRLNRFLDKESQRQENRCVDKVLGIEQRFQNRLKLSAGEFNFTYRIDRIDQLEDGTILIVDYKTGSNDPMPQKLEKLSSMVLSRDSIKKLVKSFQMPLYYYHFSQLYPGQNINAVFYNLRTLDIDEFPGKGGEVDRAGVHAVFLKALDHVLSEILDPELGFRPDDRDVRICDTCPFFNVCR